MQPVIFRPRITIETLADLVEFWQKGVKAARTNITFAVQSTETGAMNLNDFVGVSEAQMPLLGQIKAEMRTLTESGEGFTKDEKFSLSFTRHDSVVTLETYLLAWSQLAGLSYQNAREWYENARARFGLDLTPMQYLQTLAESYLPQRSKKGINIFVVETDDTWAFRNEHIDSRARIVFENLIHNAIKYGKLDGTLAIKREGNDLIFEDNGIGMDPSFAARLGRDEFLREERVNGIHGTGTGWVSIGRELTGLGWDWSIQTAPGHGTMVIIHMKEEDIVPYVPRLSFHVGRFYMTHPVTAHDIVRGARIFIGAQPFDGYRFVENGSYPGKIDVTQSPIYMAIINSYILVPPLIITPLHVMAPPPMHIAI